MKDMKSMKGREEVYNFIFLKLHVLHALHGEKVLCSLREAEEILTMKDILVQSATLRLRLLHGTGEEHEGKRGERFSVHPVKHWLRQSRVSWA